MFKADLTQSEVFPKDKSGAINPHFPHDGQCKSGHRVASSKTRFFLIQGRTLSPHRWGVYCETCLKTANKLAAQKRADKHMR